MDIKYPVNCPLMGGCSIDIGTCFDIHMVVSGEAPKWTAPEKIYETPASPVIIPPMMLTLRNIANAMARYLIAF